MNFDDVSTAWAKYKQRQVDYFLHPNTVVPEPHGLPGYKHCGEDGARVIASALTLAPTQTVKSVLDFGCGYGRVARHLRAMFPSATLHFSDIKVESANFCASQFNGTAVPTDTDLLKLALPGNYDLIWVGSVFTHLDIRRMVILFDALITALAPKGLLVATFHGRQATRSQNNTKSLMSPERWAVMHRAYEAVGIGYEEYHGTPGWGASLTTPEVVISLGRGSKTQSSLVCYTEAGWVNFHDVAAWSRN